MDYLEFESFFHQLVPEQQEQRRAAMAEMASNLSASSQEVPPQSVYSPTNTNGPQLFLPNFDEKKGKLCLRWCHVTCWYRH